MNPRMIIMRLAGTVFGIVCLFHLLRVIVGVDVVIGGWLIPIWVNWVGFPDPKKTAPVPRGGSLSFVLRTSDFSISIRTSYFQLLNRTS